ncbi:metallophosphoesterase, partial [Roseovarius nubinhibens]
MIAPSETLTPDKEVQDCALFRLMATSDVHANLLPYDYFTDQGDQPYGLSRLATLIRELRIDCANTLLVDNGDMMQGTPLSDFARAPSPDISPEDRLNPIIDAMNALGYDAAGLGNHEFNFGL